MILTPQDKIEFLKAALKSKDPEIGRWLTTIVDTLDDLPEGKQGAPCPPYRQNVPHPVPPWDHSSGRLQRRQDDLSAVVPRG